MQDTLSNVVDSQKKLRQFLITENGNHESRDNMKLIQLVIQNIDYTLELLEKFDDDPQKLSRFLVNDKNTTDSYIRYEIIKRFFFSN